MNPELKAKWIAALRSGKYKQTKEALRKDDGFCCLGVLCDVIDPNGWGNELKKPSSGFVNVEGYPYTFSDGTVGIESIPNDMRLQFDLAKVARVTRHDPEEEGHEPFSYEESIMSILMDSNDSYGQTFEQIADYIEENL